MSFLSYAKTLSERSSRSELRVPASAARALAFTLAAMLPAMSLAALDQTVPENLPAAPVYPGERPLCLYVSSYHVGYDWSDGVERGLRDVLEGNCVIEQFDMDTKRQRDKDDIVAAAAAANTLIERLAPDIIITSDDNAAKYLIVPYLVDGPIPVVFSGVNWTVEEYGFPASNVTGIVEVAPIRPMIREALTLAPDSAQAVYVGALTLTEKKNFNRIADAAWTFGVKLDSVFAETFDEWKIAFDYAQSYDFVIIGSHSGIDDWSEEEASAYALARTRRPSLTNHSWMMSVSAIGYTKLAEEHGERAGATALAILKGTAMRDIPLVTNSKWDTWINVALTSRLDTPIPERLTRRAKEVGR